MSQGPNPSTRLQAKNKKLWQKEEAYANAKKAPKTTCNCNTCHGGRAWTRKVVCCYLNSWGCDPTLRDVQPTSISSHLNISIYSHVVSKMSTCEYFDWSLLI
jgi:hypothetical protein